MGGREETAPLVYTGRGHLQFSLRRGGLETVTLVYTGRRHCFFTVGPKRTILGFREVRVLGQCYRILYNFSFIGWPCFTEVY